MTRRTVTWWGVRWSDGSEIAERPVAGSVTWKVATPDRSVTRTRHDQRYPSSLHRTSPGITRCRSGTAISTATIDERDRHDAEPDGAGGGAAVGVRIRTRSASRGPRWNAAGGHGAGQSGSKKIGVSTIISHGNTPIRGKSSHGDEVERRPPPRTPQARVRATAGPGPRAGRRPRPPTTGRRPRRRMDEQTTDERDVGPGGQPGGQRLDRGRASRSGAWPAPANT